MNELNCMVTKHFTHKTKLDIIISGSNLFGEGEHKLFDYIRLNKKQHSTQTTMIYGLESTSAYDV